MIRAMRLLMETFFYIELNHHHNQTKHVSTAKHAWSKVVLIQTNTFSVNMFTSNHAVLQNRHKLKSYQIFIITHVTKKN